VRPELNATATSPSSRRDLLPVEEPAVEDPAAREDVPVTTVVTLPERSE
jgi:hypothetical protein